MLIRQAAFTQDRHMLKGELHCHTTRSDGKTTPEDTIRQYARADFDFLALTDHRYYNFVNYAPETGVLIIPGMEMDGSIPTDEGMCFHIVAIGPERDQNGYHQDEKLESAPAPDQFAFQPTIDSIRARNNLAIYCHPQWSCTPARSFEKLNGCFAMEIWNSGCAMGHEIDTDNGFIWDELLVKGKRIFAVATDDGHSAAQHTNGWVRVNAEKSVSAILEALEAGAFYSSCGPEIYDFYIENGIAYLDCSPCEYIHFQFGRRPTLLHKNPEGEITHSQLKLDHEVLYLRATVMDKNGKKAWTNPIFIK